MQPLAAPGKRLHRNEIIGLLAPSLGHDKAAQLVVEASVELGLSTFEYTIEDATLVLSHLAQIPGLTGITAVLARSRLHKLS
jgi:hypothetical protein